MLRGRFPERGKQDVCLAASMDGFTAVRKAPPQHPACVDRGAVRHNPPERGYRSPDIVTSSGAFTK